MGIVPEVCTIRVKIFILGINLGYSAGQARFYKEDLLETTRYEEKLKNIIIP